MRDHLLEKARQQAETTGLSVRAAALLRIARVEAHGDHSQARHTLLEGLDAVQKLTRPVREYLLAEARAVAAAVSPEMRSCVEYVLDGWKVPRVPLPLGSYRLPALWRNI
jgi:hypothetical protein